MKLRKFTSIGLMVTAFIVMLTGIILLFHSPWKIYLKVGHEYFGYAMILFTIIHVVYNIKPLKSYIISKRFHLPISGEFVMTSVLAVALIAFTLSIAGNKGNHRKDFSYPGVESMPLAVVLKESGIDYADAMELLKNENYVIPEEKLTLASLSKANKKSPKYIYAVLSSQNTATRVGL